jgi:hypothetical protein
MTEVNDLIQTSKDLFNIHEVEMGIWIQPSTVYQKEGGDVVRVGKIPHKPNYSFLVKC